MPTSTIEPNSVAGVTYSAFSLTGSDKVSAVTDASDATYVSHAGTGAARQGWFWPSLTMAKLTTFTVRARGQNNTAVHPLRVYARFGGADTDSAGFFTNFPIGSFAERSYTDPVSVNAAQFNSAEWGVLKPAGADPNALTISEMAMDVTYDSPYSAAIVAIFGWLPPLLAVASHAISAREIARALRWMKTRPSNEEDFRRILEAFQVRPVFLT